MSDTYRNGPRAVSRLTPRQYRVTQQGATGPTFELPVLGQHGPADEGRAALLHRLRCAAFVPLDDREPEGYGAWHKLFEHQTTQGVHHDERQS